MSDKRSMRMIFPQRRTMSAEDIRSWAVDVWNDEAPARRCLLCGTVTVGICAGRPMREVEPGEWTADAENHPCASHEPEIHDVPVHTEPEPITLEDCASFLEDHGLATFARS